MREDQKHLRIHQHKFNYHEQWATLNWFKIYQFLYCFQIVPDLTKNFSMGIRSHL